MECLKNYRSHSDCTEVVRPRSLGGIQAEVRRRLGQGCGGKESVWDKSLT